MTQSTSTPPALPASSARARGRLVVLASGRGSNLLALLDACRRDSADAGSDPMPPLQADVVLVVSDQPAAIALDRARSAGIPAIALSARTHREAGGSRVGYDRRLADVIARSNPDLVILAGFMHVLSPEFVERFSGRLLNLHPALPGAFPGLHAIERAQEAFERGEIGETGVMVHHVVAEVDAGAPVRVEALPMRSGEPLAALEARVHALEHRLLVAAVADMLAAIPDDALAAVRPPPPDAPEAEAHAGDVDDGDANPSDPTRDEASDGKRI